jgi:four helix bundle protein
VLYEFRRDVDIAHGSIAEVDHALRLAHDLGYLPDHEWPPADDAAQEFSRMLASFLRKITERLERSGAKPANTW